VFWVNAALVALAIGVAAFALAGSSVGGVALDPTNAAPEGAMAVAEVLKQQGVTVAGASSFADMKQAIDDPKATTLFVYDEGQFLSPAQWRELAGLASQVIIADASFTTLRVVAPAVAQAGAVDQKLAADCDVPFVERAESVSGPGSGYRVIGESAGLVACLGSGDDVFSLVQFPRGATGTVSILGATAALTNDRVIDDGNAAFALGLLGQNSTLVWYLPSFADYESTGSSGPATLGELTPTWVTPVLVLLVLTFVVAAIWRGRRFGPLVIENLPVTVRASETMLGRARLYERSGARLRALDALRIGSMNRLATLCGLPRLATVDDVVGAVAAATGKQVATVRALLVDDIPRTDRDLVALSDALLILERDVTRATRP
jgi:hypothetical protein